MSNKLRIKTPITWPKMYFTLEDLLKQNPSFKEITLRVRLRKYIEEDRTVAEIGNVSGEQGRPKKIFCKLPITKEILQAAENKGIMLLSNAKELINLSTVPVKKQTIPPVSSFVVNSLQRQLTK